MKKFFLALVFFSSLTQPLFAQGYDDEAGAKIEKLERDVMTLQRQVARSGGGSSDGGSAPAAGGSADLEVRLSAIEEQMRKIMGKVEETEFQNKKMAESLEKLQKDTDFRFNELSSSAVKKPINTPDKPADAQPAATTTDKSAPTGRTVEEAIADSKDTPVDLKFDSARDHYNYAFRLLNQTQYDNAATAFALFTKKYPQDPLIGNAYYWLGETFYIRHEYVKAADSFRQGFEAMPNGSKAPDNLLKLAMTLNSLKQNKESCVVLSQVVKKFKDTQSASSTVKKAEQEIKRNSCE